MSDQHNAELDNRDIPPAVSEQFKVALGLDEPPTTLSEWADAVSALINQAGITVGFEDLCTTKSGQHTAQLDGETYSFHCVFDTLFVPFCLDEPSEIEVRSRSPVSGDVIEIRISREHVDVTPENAVMSFGVATEIETPTNDAISPALAYERFCPYVNVFVSQAEYEQWARETPETVTMSVPMKEAYSLAREMASVT